MKYVDVIVDNNTDATDCFYTYKCPFDEVKPGASVMLPFSVHNKQTQAYVAAVSELPPEGVKRFKAVSEIVDNDCLTAEAMDTAVWMRGRCLCRYIEAVKCFLPGYTPGKRKIKDPFADVNVEPDDAKALNAEQAAALEKLNAALDSRSGSIYLLHGVTGAGKTEVYLQAAARCIEQGRQIIVLVPEISLTPQTVSRFMNRFGREAVAVIHSRLTPAQKGVEYAKIRSGSVKLVIGARSAVFAPFENIGLIIVDEEHESSYKSDHSPKYSGIDVAARRAMKHGAVLLLGSATPSIEDYHRAKTGVFGLIELRERYNKNPLPIVETVDMAEELRHGNRGIISARLAELMAQSLERGRQARNGLCVLGRQRRQTLRHRRGQGLPVQGRQGVDPQQAEKQKHQQQHNAQAAFRIQFQILSPPSKWEQAQVLQQDLQADEDQDHAPGDLRLRLVLQAEDVPDVDAQGRQQKGGHADETGGRQDANRKEGKGDAHSQRVDAGGHSQQQHGAHSQIVAELLGLLRLPDHAQADDRQQGEGDPVIHAGDEALEAKAQQPAQQRHQRLKAPEIGAHQDSMPRPQAPQTQALADGDREGVHAQAHSDQQQFKQAHAQAAPYSSSL